MFIPIYSIGAAVVSGVPPWKQRPSGGDRQPQRQSRLALIAFIKSGWVRSHLNFEEGVYSYLVEIIISFHLRFVTRNSLDNYKAAGVKACDWWYHQCFRLWLIAKG